MPWKPLDGDDFPTLGWHIADQMTEYLARPDCGEYEPFMPTQEQTNFLVRLYELDPVTGQRVKHRGVLSRPRGWGKSPFLGAIAIAEAMFDVRFGGWDAAGQPVGVPWHRERTPLVLVTAVTDEQTDNTWSPVLEMLRNGSAVDEFRVNPMDTFVALDRGRIEPRTSSARSAKGARAVAAIMDQTEEWVKGNGGVRFAQVLRNNATKLGGVTIESPNAFTVGEKSVAESTAGFWQDIQAGRLKSVDHDEVRSLLYDHREAPDGTDTGDRVSLIAGLRVAYGDSSDHPGGCVLHEPPCEPGWSPIGRIATDFWDTSNDPAVMEADFLNRIGSASDAFIQAPELRAVQDLGKVVSKSEPVTLGFDGSEGRKPGKGIADSTVLIGYSVKQKHIFQLGVWEQPGPTKEGEESWKPPKLAVEAAVREAFKNYNVIGFYADPSAGWAAEVKQWEADHHKRLQVKVTRDEPIRWKQKDVSNTCDGFDQMHSAIQSGEVTYDGSAALTAHFLNARKDPRRAGYVLKKPDDDQDYAKIDATWGAMFAYKAGLDALGKGIATRKRGTPRRIY